MTRKQQEDLLCWSNLSHVKAGQRDLENLSTRLVLGQNVKPWVANAWRHFDHVELQYLPVSQHCRHLADQVLQVALGSVEQLASALEDFFARAFYELAEMYGWQRTEAIRPHC